MAEATAIVMEDLLTGFYEMSTHLFEQGFTTEEAAKTHLYANHPELRSDPLFQQYFDDIFNIVVLEKMIGPEAVAAAMKFKLQSTKK